MASTNEQAPAPKQENILLSIGLNILAPVLVLSKLSEKLGPEVAIVVALAFPLLYGLWDFKDRKQVNYISLLGLIGVGLTGGFSLLKMDPFWLAVKEASIPALIGIGFLVTHWLGKPLLKTLLYNPQLFNTPLIEEKIDENNNRSKIAPLFGKCTWIMVGSFIFSAVMNFILARMIVTTHPELDMIAYNKEFGKLTWLSYIVIAIPSMVFMIAAFWIYVKGLMKLTGLKFEDLLHEQHKEKAKEKTE